LIKDALLAARGAWEAAQPILLKASVIMNVLFVLALGATLVLFERSCSRSKQAEKEIGALRGQVDQKTLEVQNVRKSNEALRASFNVTVKNYEKSESLVGGVFSNATWMDMVRRYKLTNGIK